HPQLRGLRDAREAGRYSGHSDSGLVHSEPDWRVRDRLLTALRPRSFPHARLPDDSERRRVSKVARRSGKGTAAGPSDADGPVSTKLGRSEERRVGKDGRGLTERRTG